MKTYLVKRKLRRPVFVKVGSTLELRRECRRYLGWRRSARYTYQQIGANSFKVFGCWGLTVLDVYLYQ